MGKLSLLVVIAGFFIGCGASAIECPAGEPFAGAVKKLKSGPCQGRWGLDTFIGSFLPTNLPPEYEGENYRVAGCMERKADPKPCTVGKDSYRLVEIYSIWPD